MAIVGMDIGNITSVACCGDKVFVTESRITPAKGMDNLAGVKIFEFNGEKYASNSGDFEYSFLKYNKNNFLKLLYYSASRVTTDSVIDLSIGIPAAQYNSKRSELKKLIEKNRTATIDGRKITIDKITIVPEGYGLKAMGILQKCKPNVPTIVVDIGGGTTDIAVFDGKNTFKDGQSIKYGLLNIYEKARIVLDDEYDVTLEIYEAKKYFDGDEELLGVNNKYKNAIMKDAIAEIINKLRRKFPNLKFMNIVLTGGGAKKIHPTFTNVYPHAILVDDITLNARGFYRVGVSKWKK